MPHRMKREKILLNCYSFAWKTALLFLKQSSMFKDSYKLRTSEKYFSSSDIWMHGASGGEAFIAIEILKRLKPKQKQPLKILYTATTVQGLETMESFCASLKPDSNINCQIRWFPFDMPQIIESIILKTKPSIMVLLETELWPGHLYMLKKHGIKTIIINARLSAKSYPKYLKTSFLWKKLSPEKIVATSKKDAKRFKEIMGKKTSVEIMPNIKFDSIPVDTDNDENNTDNVFVLKNFLPSDDYPISILASIRKEEEIYLNEIVEYLFKNYPDQVIAIFPKHIQRIKALTDQFEKLKNRVGFELKIRSQINSKVNKKTVILWDTFGELKTAYAYCVTAFVGGSLKSLGGQNFLEPVINGAACVTGRYLNSFKWVDEEIFESKLVFKAQNADEVSKFMVKNLINPPDKIKLKQKAAEFIKKNQGGTDIAVKLITAMYQT